MIPFSNLLTFSMGGLFNQVGLANVSLQMLNEAVASVQELESLVAFKEALVAIQLGTIYRSGISTTSSCDV